MTAAILTPAVPPLEVVFPDRPPLPIEMTKIARGMGGPPGPQGEPGVPGNAVDLPDLSLIFDNVLAGLL